MTKYHQGFYKPKYPEKYKGNSKNIVYRSSWELSLMRMLDGDKNIAKWSSEETVLPYVSPLDGKRHRYFVDFWYQTVDGKKYLVEVKPKKQTMPPKPSKTKSKRYIQEVTTWAVNDAKWKAARRYCKEKDMKFLILTEDHILKR